MDKRKFHAIPLTPIHIGTGDAMTPEEFYTEGSDMVRFHPGLVLQGMSDPERRKYESLIDQGRIGDAWQQLRAAARLNSRARLYRVAMGATAKQEMEGILGQLERRTGEVRPMPRHPHTGHVMIPGSAIKGAIRTAVLNGYLSQDESVRARLYQGVRNATRSELKQLHARLESETLRGGGEIENDPFRLIHVGDASINPEQVRVDRATLVKPDGTHPQARGGKGPGHKMYVERLVSRADGMKPKGFTVEIGIDNGKAAQCPKVRELVRRLPDWNFLVQSCDSFYRGRYEAERDKFSNFHTHVKEQWLQDVRNLRGVLLRVGRYSHFESLSVDHLRRGDNPQTQSPIYGMGSTRTVCEIGGTDDQVIFGWLALIPLRENAPM